MTETPTNTESRLKDAAGNTLEDDPGELVDIIAYHSVMGHDTANAKRQFTEALEALIDERVRKAIADMTARCG